MAIIADTLGNNRFDKTVTGAAHGVIWPASNTDYFEYPTGVQIISKGISVASAGLYAFTMASGIAVTVYLAAGIIHPIHAKRYLSTGTTGTGDLIVWF